MKKKSAAFTIVHNEKDFLPLWISHHKKTFCKEDIYILDDGSTDGSTDNLDVNVIKLNNKYSFDHNFLCGTVANFQNKLLENYEVVLFSEIDEFLVMHPDSTESLAELINDMKQPLYRCWGWAIHQEPEELPIDLTTLIINQRKFGYFEQGSCKVYLSTLPLRWSVGFHDSHGQEIYTNLLLIHLHRVDIPIFFTRQNSRLERSLSPRDPLGSGLGDYNKIKKTLDEVKTEFSITHTQYAQLLPDFIKRVNF